MLSHFKLFPDSLLPSQVTALFAGEKHQFSQVDAGGDLSVQQAARDVFSSMYTFPSGIHSGHSFWWHDAVDTSLLDDRQENSSNAQCRDTRHGNNAKTMLEDAHRLLRSCEEAAIPRAVELLRKASLEPDLQDDSGLSPPEFRVWPCTFRFCFTTRC